MTSIIRLLNPISFEKIFSEERDSKKAKTEESVLPAFTPHSRIQHLRRFQECFNNIKTEIDKKQYNVHKYDVKITFRVHFNINFGYFNLVDARENPPKFSSVSIVPEFEYESETSVRLKRLEFVTDLLKNQMGLSIITAQYLLTIEKILSECHTFNLQPLVEFQGTSLSPRIYSGTLVREKLEKILHDDQKIRAVWQTVLLACQMDEDKKFLKNVPYIEHADDSPWELNFDQSSLLADEMIVVQTDRQAFFTSVDRIDFKKVLAIKRW